MAETTFVTDHHLPGRTAPDSPRQIMSGFGFSFAELTTGIAEARRELRLNQDLRGFDPVQLRDLGLDRGAC